MIHIPIFEWGYVSDSNDKNILHRDLFEKVKKNYWDKLGCIWLYFGCILEVFRYRVVQSADPDITLKFFVTSYNPMAWVVKGAKLNFKKQCFFWDTQIYNSPWSRMKKGCSAENSVEKWFWTFKSYRGLKPIFKKSEWPGLAFLAAKLFNFWTRGPKSLLNIIFGLCREPAFILDHPLGKHLLN